MYKRKKNLYTKEHLIIAGIRADLLNDNQKIDCIKHKEKKAES